MTSESAVQSQIRQQIPLQTGGLVFRNNSGAFQDESGRWIRYGLANDSKQLNEQIKSSDLICAVPEMVYIHRLERWQQVAVFTAIEVKPSGWHLTPGDKRGLAQQRFHDIVREAGGYAGFATSVDDMRRIIGR